MVFILSVWMLFFNDSGFLVQFVLMLRMDGEGSLARLVEKRIVRLLKTSLAGEIAVGRLRGE